MSVVRKAVVTGATGFIGGKLVERLCRAGWEVGVVAQAGVSLEKLHQLDHPPRILVYEGSINSLTAFVSDIKPDVVFHLASLFLPQHRPEDVARLIASNVLFASELVEAMSQAKVWRLVNTGTSWQHYNDEDYNPANLYAATKEAFETIMRFYLETSPLKAICLTLFDTYGPGDERMKLTNLLIKHAKEGTLLKMSPGGQMLDLVHIDDIIAAYLAAADRLCGGAMADSYEEFAVTTGSPRCIRDVVEVFQQATGMRVNVEWGGRPYRDREIMTTWAKGVTLPGWHADVTLYDGFKTIMPTAR